MNTYILTQSGEIKSNILIMTGFIFHKDYNVY